MPNRKLIPLALNISDKTYADLVYNRGLDWIIKFFSLNDEEILFTIAKSHLFWAWWKNQWAIRDEQFCHDISLVKQELPLTGAALKMAKELYLDLHALENIDVIPNRFAKDDMVKLLVERRKQEEVFVKSLS